MISHLTVIIIAFFTRFIALGEIPPGGQNAFWFRFPSALSGVLSIIFLILIVEKITADKRVSFLSGLILALMPWHIEQSRVVSPAMMGLTVFLAGALMGFYLKQKVLKVLVVLGTAWVFYLVFPTFWIFTEPVFSLSIKQYVGNLFKLISIEFLFFKNDTFWSGGLRNVGVMLPSSIILFMLGLFSWIRNISRAALSWCIFFIVIWLVAAANRNFPEGREYFLISPYFAVIIAFGINNILEHFRYSNYLVKIIILIYFIFLCYEYIGFAHYYINHYSPRIANEIPYEKINF